jgi:transposase InsO family protein
MSQTAASPGVVSTLTVTTTAVTTAAPVTFDNTPRSYSHIPVLTRDNYLKWQLCVKAYLMPGDHIRVIKHTKTATGVLADPVPLADPAELERWNRSEWIAMGVVMGTANDQHLELIHKHEEGSVWALWKAIEAHHVQCDASLHHEVWMQLLSIRKNPDEKYVDLYSHVDNACSKINCVTLSTLTTEERTDELALFTILTALPVDDPLRQQLVSQKDITLADTYSAFLCTDRDTVTIESANAAYVLRCHRCDQPGHFADACPHLEAIKQLISQCSGGSNGHSNSNGNRNYRGGRHRGRGRNGANAANANTPGSSSSGSSSNNNISPASTTHETAGVASMFLSNKSHTADNDWLCDSGASSSMSGNRSAFSSLRADRRPICLADGRIVYSKGVGSIQFLSNFGYTIVIHGVLFVPFLAQNLFALNKFARERRNTHMEVMEYPTSRWVNHRTGATEFTATVCSNDLVYLDWKVAPSVESACVSISELHSQLNHMPHSVVQRLVQSRAVSGIPSHIEGTAADDFCEDCVNGKLTRAPHAKPATRAEQLLFWVFLDVHGPVPVQSWQGHFYWVTFIDDHSRFPAVYFLTKKLDVFGAFRQYKAWAENVMGHRIRILRDDKGGEYVTGDFKSFLADAGIHREHSIRDTPQQVRVAERMNRSIAEGITTVLSQSGLTHTWWEDAATHWLHGKIRLPSSATAPSTPFELFYSRKPDLSLLRPFGCLAYVHLQKDQHPALLLHAAQCIFIGYPVDYKGWKFWDPQVRKEIISDSAVFQESVFPFHKSGLSGVDKSVDHPPPNDSILELATILFPPLPDLAARPLASEAPPPLPVAPAVPGPELRPNPVVGIHPDPVVRLVAHVQVPPPVPPPLLHDLPERP